MLPHKNDKAGQLGQQEPDINILMVFHFTILPFTFEHTHHKSLLPALPVSLYESKGLFHNVSQVIY